MAGVHALFLDMFSRVYAVGIIPWVAFPHRREVFKPINDLLELTIP